MKRAGFAFAVTLVLLWSIGPFLWIVLTSVKSPEEIAHRPPTVLPHPTLTYYREVIEEHGILLFARNSAVVAGSTTIAAVLVGALAAYPLARMSTRRRGWILSLVLAASLFPQIAIAGGVYRFVRALGLLNTWPGLALPYTALALPLAIWILTSFFRELPPDIEEAARVDGCGPLATLFRIVLPLAAPGVFTAAILVFIYAWNEFFFALLITTDPAVATLPVGIAKFPGEHRIPWGDLSAAAVVATVPIVLAVLVLQRRIVRGLVAGAVKG